MSDTVRHSQLDWECKAFIEAIKNNDTRDNLIIWGYQQLNRYSTTVPALRCYSATKPMHKSSAGYSLQSGSLAN